MRTLNKKQINSVFLKIVAAAVVGALLSSTTAHAFFYEDSESSTANVFSSTSLDLGLASDEDNFEPNDGWIPGSSAERIFFVTNEGDLPFVYGLKYTNGDSNDLCENTELQVMYDGDELYNDKLEDFDIFYDSGDPFLDHMMLPAGPDEHEYYFKIWLPIDTNGDAADETCNFDIAAYAWQEPLEPYTGFWDEDSLSNEIESADWEGDLTCNIGETVFMIGDEDDPMENPVDELNWPGEFGVFPDFADPFVVGTNNDNEFPWNSNYVKDEATDFDIDFFYAGKDGLAKLTISWSPGRSAAEQKEVFLDGDSVGTTPNRTGVSTAGWWENMPRFEDEFIFPLSQGTHTLNLKHLKGDGTLWDWVELEIIGCSAGEGDVIINEIMWMGSDSSFEDEWVELYNDTDHDINLDYWTIDNAGDGSKLTLPVGSVIPAHSYYLISNFAADDGDSALSDTNISPDYITGDLDLDNDGETLTLKDAFENTVDEADGGSGWPAGENGDDKKSMERNDVPSTGWHTCTDSECNDTDFWDSEGDNYGTPKAENKSENDPSQELLQEILEDIGEPVLDVVPNLEVDLSAEEAVEETVEDIPTQDAVIKEEETVEGTSEEEGSPDGTPPTTEPDEETTVEEPAEEEITEEIVNE